MSSLDGADSYSSLDTSHYIIIPASFQSEDNMVIETHKNWVTIVHWPQCKQHKGSPDDDVHHHGQWICATWLQCSLGTRVQLWHPVMIPQWRHRNAAHVQYIYSRVRLVLAGIDVVFKITVIRQKLITKVRVFNKVVRMGRSTMDNDKRVIIENIVHNLPYDSCIHRIDV